MQEQQVAVAGGNGSAMLSVLPVPTGARTSS